MSKTFARGLELLTVIGRQGPISVTELAKTTGADKSAVSRMLSAIEPEGWIIRVDGRIILGPRAALLGSLSPSVSTLRRAGQLAEAISGVTGLIGQAYGLVGERVTVLAMAAGGQGERIANREWTVPLYATAAGTVIASQLPSPMLDKLLPAEPYPNPVELMAIEDVNAGWSSRLGVDVETLPPPSADVALTRRQLDAQLASIRAARSAHDDGGLVPEIGCIAMPWSPSQFPAALACMGSPDEVADAEPLIRAALTAATAPGATREDVVLAAAGILRSRRSTT